MTKYVGAMVRKSIRVQIAAERERFEVDDVLRWRVSMSKMMFDE